MAEYLIWCPELGHSGPEDGKAIRAGEPETAVAIWAKREDAESADYWIAGGVGTTVVVRTQFGVDTTYRVRGEPSIDYFARATT